MRLRILSAFVRSVVRREDWGTEQQLVRRARRLFGAPTLYGRLAGRGLTQTAVATRDITGEWLSPAAPLPGVILYVHGGGFVSCSARTHRPIAAALARYTHRRVFSTEYRLAPEHRHPAGQDDVVLAYRWLSSTVGAERIAIAGDSAGGNLALGLAVRARDEGLRMPACVAAFSPWLDLAARGESIRTNDGRCAMFRTRNFADFAGAALGTTAPDDPRVSPAHADLGGLPPALLQVGSTELLLDDARNAHARICESGGTSRLEVFADAPHCWQMLTPWVPEAALAIRHAGDFIVAHVR